jgi:hypothetical protein
MNVIYRVTDELNLPNEKKTTVYFRPAGNDRRGSGHTKACEPDSAADDTPPGGCELPAGVWQTARIGQM